MSEHELRMWCIQLAKELGGDPPAVIVAADMFFRYVKDGLIGVKVEYGQPT